jgi:hypothetical protein
MKPAEPSADALAQRTPRSRERCAAAVAGGITLVSGDVERSEGLVTDRV